VILTELPDLPHVPTTPRAVAFRRDFYRRWGRENCIVSGTSRRAEYGLFRQTLSIKCVAHGNETYFVDRRRVTVSDETFLILNEGREYASSLISPAGAYSFSIFFRPGLAQEILGDVRRPLRVALDDGPRVRPGAMEFDESLQHHHSRITPVLRFIQRSVVAGVRDESWLEEQCQFLLERMIMTQRPGTPMFAVEYVNARRPQRKEVKRRLNWAIDFMHAHLAEEVTLANIAVAARLSRFHFLRAFQSEHGLTPREFLRELRRRRALALLDSTTLNVSEIATKVGMSRTALWRALQADADEPACAVFLPRAGVS